MANRVLTVANHVYSVANRDVANRDCGESRVIPDAKSKMTFRSIVYIFPFNQFILRTNLSTYGLEMNHRASIFKNISRGDPCTMCTPATRWVSA